MLQRTHPESPDDAVVAARYHRVETVNPIQRQALEHIERTHRELLLDEEQDSLYALIERIRLRFGVSFLIGTPYSVSRQSGLRSTSNVRPPISNDARGVRGYNFPAIDKYKNEVNCCRMQQKRLHKSHERSAAGEQLNELLQAGKHSLEAAMEGALTTTDASSVVMRRSLPDISSSDSLDDLSHASSCRSLEEYDHNDVDDVKSTLRLPHLSHIASPPHSRRPVSGRTTLKTLAGCQFGESSHQQHLTTASSPNKANVPTPPSHKQQNPARNLPSVRALLKEVEKEEAVAAHVLSSSKDFHMLSATSKHAMVENDLRHKRLVEEKFGNREKTQKQHDAEEEERWRVHYRAVRLEEQAQARCAAEERELGVLGRRREQESLRAALAFVEGEERRERTEIEKLFTADGPQKRKWLAQAIADGRVAEELALHSGEARRLEEEAARVKLEAEKIQEAKRRAEFNKEQQLMKNSCTHSRSGTSVFVGTTSKNVCLVCKVKFDTRKKLYVRLR